MPRVEPEILAQRYRTPILLPFLKNIRLSIASAKVGRICYPILGSVVHHIIKEGVCVKDHRCRSLMCLLKHLAAPLEQPVPPLYHLLAGQRAHFALVAGCPIEWWEVDEQEMAVPCAVQRVDAFREDGADDRVIEVGKGNIVFGRVVDIVDADPDGHEGAVRINAKLLLKDVLAIG